MLSWLRSYILFSVCLSTMQSLNGIGCIESHRQELATNKSSEEQNGQNHNSPTESVQQGTHSSCSERPGGRVPGNFLRELVDISSCICLKNEMCAEGGRGYEDE